VTDQPGVLISAVAPPPAPGSEPAQHPFVSATAYAPEHEERLRALLDASVDPLDFLGRLRAEGYRVEES
jgi:hypothetical protein